VFLPSNEIAIERVFPIRNLVGDAEDLPAPAVQQDALIEKGSPGENPPGVPKEKAPTTYAKPPYLKIPPKESFQRLSDNDDSYISSASEGQQRRKTDRSTLVPADPTLAGPPGVLLGTLSRDTKKDTFCRCEDEPIHTPGAIQNYGALLALRFNALGDLEVRIASENARSFLGYALEDLFTLRSFFDILDQESKAEMIARVNHALKQVDISKNEDTHLDVFEVSVMLPPPFQTPKSLWCAIHIANGTDDLIICEFEEYTEVFRLEEQYAKTLPPTPIYTLDMEVHPDELKKSTSRASLPLRVLQIARRKKQRGVSSMDIFNGMTQAQEQLATAKNAQEVMDKVVGIIAELTGFHRVMFYRFDNHKNGCVDAELINTKASGDLFRGLHFPASDIPSQARALYKINRIRILSDRDAETARLVYLPVL
jgi:light-regulated signal transduction histidine kinase (bacteriophytochrome)